MVGIGRLQEASGLKDVDMIDTMQTAVETHAHPQQAFMLCPSSKSLENFEQFRVASQKAADEEAKGIIERYPGPMFCPMRAYQEGYAEQHSGKLRRVGMGNSPRKALIPYVMLRQKMRFLLLFPTSTHVIPIHSLECYLWLRCHRAALGYHLAARGQHHTGPRPRTRPPLQVR